MPNRIRLRKKKQQVCIGDLRDEIIIQDRDVQPPISGSDFTELFSNNQVRAAMVNTVKGKTFFDGVSKEEVNITHEITFRFDPLVVTENWIILKTDRLRILELTNLDERDDWLMATCTDRGLSTLVAASI